MAVPITKTRKPDGSIKLSDPTVASRMKVLKAQTPKTAVTKPLDKLDLAFKDEKRNEQQIGLGSIDTSLLTPIPPKARNPYRRKLANAKSKA